MVLKAFPYSKTTQFHQFECQEKYPQQTSIAMENHIFVGKYLLDFPWLC